MKTMRLIEASEPNYKAREDNINMSLKASRPSRKKGYKDGLRRLGRRFAIVNGGSSFRSKGETLLTAV